MTTVLIANRGAIAARIIRTCRRLGIASIAVYAAPDTDAAYVAAADASREITGARPVDAYLDGAQIIRVAQEMGADAIHPGYGFLSENADFARACQDAGLEFVGPSADVIAQMGDKDIAKQAAQQAGVPTIPGVSITEQNAEELAALAESIGYPVLLKAVAGGGGKGMRRVESADTLQEDLAAARREAKAAFNHDGMLMEKYVLRPRHIEVQILADQHGLALHFGERDCSSQRRHQKIIEEAPSPAVSPELRERMGASAVALAQACGYSNAGTVEFLLDAEGQYYFLEMNTRLQVEHAVTEEVYGLDLVEWQLRVSAGEALPWVQHDLAPRGHAIECRLYAEDVPAGFLPTTGRIAALEWPEQPAARIESGVQTGSRVTVDFDPMLAKVITRADNRDAAICAMRAFLADTIIAGVTTNREFLMNVLSCQEFLRGEVDTNFIEAYVQRPNVFQAIHAADPFSPWRSEPVAWRWAGTEAAVVPPAPARAHGGGQVAGDARAPMPGRILSVLAQEQSRVRAGDTLVIMEAMKMEYSIKAPYDGVVSAVHVRADDMVERGKELVVVQAEAS